MLKPNSFLSCNFVLSDMIRIAAPSLAWVIEEGTLGKNLTYPGARFYKSVNMKGVPPPH